MTDGSAYEILHEKDIHGEIQIMKNDEINISGGLRYRVIAIIELVLILGIVIGIPAYLIFIHPEIWYNFKSIEAFELFMKRHEEMSIPIYFGCQMIQVVVTVLPGQVIQIAGGYFYGFFLSMLLSIAGITCGSGIAFMIARMLGQRPVALIFGEQKFLKYKEMLDTKKAHMIIFLLYLIPGFPKDMLAYAAGVSRMRFTTFIVLSMVGRLPSMTMSLLMGGMLERRNYTGAVILAIFVVIICFICFLKRNALMGLADIYYEKLNNKNR